MFQSCVESVINTVDIRADLGIQTIHTVTGLGTLNEVIQVANVRDLRYLAITDQYNIDNPVRERMYLNSLVGVRDSRVKVIPGIELSLEGVTSNIMRDIRELSWVTISDYTTPIRERSLEAMQMSYTRVANSGIKAFPHPEQSYRYLLGSRDTVTGLVTETKKEFYSWFIPFCKSRRLWLGVSELSARERDLRPELIYWLKLAIANNNLLYLCSDARHSQDVGDFTSTLEILNKLGVKKRQILNCNQVKLEQLFGKV